LANPGSTTGYKLKTRTFCVQLALGVSAAADSLPWAAGLSWMDSEKVVKLNKTHVVDVTLM